MCDCPLDPREEQSEGRKPNDAESSEHSCREEQGEEVKQRRIEPNVAVCLQPNTELRLFICLATSSDRLIIMAHTALKPKPARKQRTKIVVTQRGIFSPEEKAELEKLLPTYRMCKRTPGKKWEGFWEPTWELLFRLFPLPALTAEQIAKGIDQGTRKGERMALYQQVCEPAQSRYPPLTPCPLSESANFSITALGILHLGRLALHCHW